MSKNEYSFHNKRRNNVNPLINNNLPTGQTRSTERGAAPPIINGSIKATIMQQYDRFLGLKISNEKIKYLSETQDRLSKEIVANVGFLQKSAEKTETAQLSSKLEHLNALHKKLKEEYTELLKTELSILYENWPDLFDKVLEGVDRETLDHVLTVFEEFQKGRLDSNEAVNQGIDYMTLKYNLPRDFFDRNAVDQFNQNLHKQEKM